jgi:hypothetical protein
MLLHFIKLLTIIIIAITFIEQLTDYKTKLTFIRKVQDSFNIAISMQFFMLQLAIIIK